MPNVPTAHPFWFFLSYRICRKFSCPHVRSQFSYKLINLTFLTTFCSTFHFLEENIEICIKFYLRFQLSFPPEKFLGKMSLLENVFGNMTSTCADKYPVIFFVRRQETWEIFGKFNFQFPMTNFLFFFEDFSVSLFFSQHVTYLLVLTCDFQRRNVGIWLNSC